MTLKFSEEAEKAFEDILTRYPKGHLRAALIPALFLAQRDFGFVSVDAMEYVARRLDLPPTKVLQVATFYTMFNKRPVGKYHVQVCKSVSCAIMGAFTLLEYLEEELDIKAGETTPDGLVTLSQVECLAGCGYAPMLQCNEDYHENLGQIGSDGAWPKVDDLLDTWREG